MKSTSNTGSPARSPLFPLAPLALGAISLPASALEIIHGPYLQNVSQDGITVMWETDEPCPGSLRYQREGHWYTVSHEDSVTIHELRIEGLDPGEELPYQVSSQLGPDTVTSEIFQLTTAPAEGSPFKMVVWGDSHGGFSTILTTLVTGNGASDGMLGFEPDLMVCVGDAVDSGSQYWQWGTGLLDQIQPLASSTPYFEAIGNHEGDSHWFYDYLDQPGNEHWFALSYGAARLVFIDTNYSFSTGSEQNDWIREELSSEEAQDARWLLVFHHHPPYSEIYEESKYAQIRSYLVPLYEAAGVDVLFTGHIHDYERGIWTPEDTGRRIVYLQTSGGGGTLWWDEYDGDWPQIDNVIQYAYHYMELEVGAEDLTMNAVDLDGNVIDTVELEREDRYFDGWPETEGGDAQTQWDFTEGDLEPSYGPGHMYYLGGDEGSTAEGTSFGLSSHLGLPDISGEEAHVMAFPRSLDGSMGFQVEPAAQGNGGGYYVNEFSMVMDLLLPASSFASDDYLAILNTASSNYNAAEVFVQLASGGIGSYSFDGKIRPDTWYRVGLTFTTEDGSTTMHKYLDGEPVGDEDVGDIDGFWALYTSNDSDPFFSFLADVNGNSTSGYLSSLLFLDRPLSADEIAELGAADADGVMDEPSEPMDSADSGTAQLDDSGTQPQPDDSAGEQPSGGDSDSGPGSPGNSDTGNQGESACGCSVNRPAGSMLPWFLGSLLLLRRRRP